METRAAPRPPEAPADEPLVPNQHLVDNDLVEEALLVEDVSIDGMCGVY